MSTGTADNGRNAITTPRPDQFEALYRLDRESFSGADAYTYSFLRQLFDAFRRDYLVLADGDRLLGYILGVRNSGENEGTIMDLCVAPDVRRRGYGRELLDAGVKRLRVAGVAGVGLMVDPANTSAYRLYRSYGFEFVRHRPGHFGPGQDRDELRLALG